MARAGEVAAADCEVVGTGVPLTVDVVTEVGESGSETLADTVPKRESVGVGVRTDGEGTDDVLADDSTDGNGGSERETVCDADACAEMVAVVDSTVGVAGADIEIDGESLTQDVCVTLVNAEEDA